MIVKFVMQCDEQGARMVQQPEGKRKYDGQPDRQVLQKRKLVRPLHRECKGGDHQADKEHGGVSRPVRIIVILQWKMTVVATLP